MEGIYWYFGNDIKLSYDSNSLIKKWIINKFEKESFGKINCQTKRYYICQSSLRRYLRLIDKLNKLFI